VVEWFNSLLIPLLRGLVVTVELAILVLFFGTIAGIFGGVLWNISGQAVRAVFTLGITLSRGIPLLVQVFFVFYVLPVFGLKFTAFGTSVLALSLFAGATITEIVRGGIMAVPHGQIDAARSLGFTNPLAMRIIVLPQALRSILPPLITQFVFLIKATSVISLLGVPELMLTGREVANRTLLGFEVMSMIWVLYTAICYPLTIIGRRLEAGLQSRGFRPALGGR
jgi:His/Glu/Gln/Arg/opine family amino acid ABC transporter permease subunit